MLESDIGHLQTVIAQLQGDVACAVKRAARAEDSAVQRVARAEASARELSGEVAQLRAREDDLRQLREQVRDAETQADGLEALHEAALGNATRALEALRRAEETQPMRTVAATRAEALNQSLQEATSRVARLEG